MNIQNFRHIKISIKLIPVSSYNKNNKNKK